MRKLLLVAYRVFFTTRQEFSDWIKATRQYEPVAAKAWDDPEHEEWLKDAVGNRPAKLLKIFKSVFDSEGNLVIYTAQQWNSDWISVSEYYYPEPADSPETATTD
jgi:hypothetical protein